MRNVSTSILNVYVEQNKVAELHGMYRHNTSLPKVTSPILVSVLVIDPIFHIIRKQILEFHWRS
jgi:hypothetical protein